MTIDRRRFLISTVAAFAASRLQAGSVEDHGLFWSATPDGGPASILFGYARTAASVAGAVVEDGRKFVQQSAMLLGDVPNVKLPTIKMDPQEMTPIASRVPLELAQRIRAYLGQNFTNLSGADKITGLTLALMLQGEGQTPAQPSVGGTIAEDAQKAGRPVAFLLTPKEYADGYQPPDVVSLDKRVTADVVDYLLNLREAVGPIGKRQESLYVARRVGDLEQFAHEMKAHGVPTFSDISGLPVDRLEAAIVGRALEAVQKARAPIFLMVPVGSLTAREGLLTKLREAHVPVRLLA